MKNTKKTIFIVTVALLAIVFVVSAVMIINYFVDGKKQADRNQELQNLVSQAQTATTEAPTEPQASQETTQGTTAATEPGMLAGYKELYDLNQDVVGYLKIDGTKLSYPVLQHMEGKDANGYDYYLYRDFDGQESKRGSVFVKEDVDVYEPSDSIVLYGHNMADGSMFAALNAYTNKATWDRNNLIFFDNLYEYHTYQVFAVFKTSMNLEDPNYFPYHKFVDAEDEADFNDFISKIKQRAFYETGITPSYGDKIIMLSTCEYTLDNGRLVVAAVRIS